METMIDRPHDELDFTYEFDDDAFDAPADPAFEAWLARTAPTLNAPGAAPADDMWTAIAAAGRTAEASAAGTAHGVLPLRHRRWARPVALAAALAATLVLGVALDRMVILRGSRVATGEATSGAATRPAAPLAAGADSASHDELYRLAAVQTLSQAEALLTAYRASNGSARDSIAARTLGGWAREVLGSTRLLIDSPAGADPKIRVLLDDIELVLVQIVRLSGTPIDSADRALIDNALRDRDLLPRIRTAVPAGAADAGIASDN
jgi:hypothetical protein